MPLGRANGVTLEAHTIVARALAHARDSDVPPMTVAVLDAAGQPVAPASDDEPTNQPSIPYMINHQPFLDA